MAQYLPSREIRTREEFPLLCEWRNLKRVVEIGVEQGLFAEMFLNRWGHFGEMYLGIDPYQADDYVGHRHHEILMASARFGKFPISRLVCSTSLEIAGPILEGKIQDRRFSTLWDFVYLDGDHSKEGVAEDIRLWWPLVSEKGILAGHDWWMPSGEHQGVSESVREFSEANNLTVWITAEDEPQSWYIYKQGIPSPGWQRVQR